jgi:hypothetical protein
LKTLEVTVPHSLGVDAAHERLDAALVRARSEYEQQVGPIDADWEAADRLRVGFTTMGMRFAGQIEILPDALTVKLDLPMMASMFAGQIREGIEQRLGGVVRG